MPISAKDLQAALPDLESTQCCEGLEKTVTIHRDPWGIPHIQAAGEADMFFAQGFATAQDRLWHMDFDRHQALGRWSEWAGSCRAGPRSPPARRWHGPHRQVGLRSV